MVSAFTSSRLVHYAYARLSGVFFAHYSRQQKVRSGNK